MHYLPPFSYFIAICKFFSNFDLFGFNIFIQARPLLKERNYPDLIDERMMDTYDCHQLFWMIRLAEKCLTRDPRKRFESNKLTWNTKHAWHFFSFPFDIKITIHNQFISYMSTSPNMVLLICCCYMWEYDCRWWVH